MSEQTSPPDKEKMSASAVAKTPAAQQSQIEKQTLDSGKSGGGMLSGFGLTQLMLVALTVVFAWQWFNGHRTISNMEQQLAEKISDMSANSKANQILMSQSQVQVRELAAKVTMMETRFGEARNQRAALEALYNDLSGNRDEAALAEVEQMLRIAMQQLKLTGNVKTALIALQSGDTRLKRMDRGAFNGLRKRIGKDIGKLRALPSLDIPALNLQLDDLISEVETLPLAHQLRVMETKSEQITSTKDGVEWKRVLREIWGEFKLMVRIENTGSDAIPLLSPDQEFFLRENMKLRLLSARIALFSRDERSFKQELDTAQHWLKKYFDSKSEQSIRIQSMLSKLVASSIKINFPDISGSLQAVRDYRQAHERAAGRSLSQKGAP
jgi:uroporphyrin-3 C-methyltransferase